MTRKKIIIIVIVVLVLIGLAIALLLTDQSFFKPSSPATEVDQNFNVAVPEVNKGAEPVLPTVVLKPAEQSAVNVARNFAERFGSFSSDSQLLNLEEVKLLATAKMQSALDQLKKELSGRTSFYGISSKALKTSITEIDETAGRAQMAVSLQRTERQDGANDFTYNQDLKLSLIKQGADWLVDEASWVE